MKKYSKRTVRRQYIISSGELKEFLGLEGTEIVQIDLYSSRSPDDVEKGVNPNNDTWEIVTKEGEEHEEGDQSKIGDE